QPPRTSHGLGMSAATDGGASRMRRPMKLASTMAAASHGPSGRSSVCGPAEEAATRSAVSERQQRAIDGELADRRPLRRSTLGEHAHGHIAELAVLQHLGARREARVADLRTDDDRVGGGRRRNLVAARHAHEHLVHVAVGAIDAEVHVELNGTDRLGAGVLQTERDLWDELVFAVDDALVVIAGDNVGEDQLLNGAGGTARRGEHDQRECGNETGERGTDLSHPPILDQNSRTETRARTSSRVMRPARNSARSRSRMRSISVTLSSNAACESNGP